MKIICVMQCEDCKSSPVSSKDDITLFALHGPGGPEIYGVSRCAYCDRFMKDDVSYPTAIALVQMGVRVFSWYTGEEMDLQELEELCQVII